MPITTQTRANRAWDGSGFTHHKAAQNATVRPVNSAIQGLRRPVRSATVPSTGLSRAIRSPATVSAALQREAPATSSPTTPRAK